MDDKAIMENLMLTTKNVCDLCLHGAIESPTANVHQTFSDALLSTISMQDTIYKQMESKGWYKAQPATPQSIQQVKQKFTQSI